MHELMVMPGVVKVVRSDGDGLVVVVVCSGEGDVSEVRLGLWEGA